jgi:hypothetical protein
MNTPGDLSKVIRSFIGASSILNKCLPKSPLESNEAFYTSPTELSYDEVLERMIPVNIPPIAPIPSREENKGMRSGLIDMIRQGTFIDYAFRHKKRLVSNYSDNPIGSGGYGHVYKYHGTEFGVNRSKRSLCVKIQKCKEIGKEVISKFDNGGIITQDLFFEQTPGMIIAKDRPLMEALVMDTVDHPSIPRLYSLALFIETSEKENKRYVMAELIMDYIETTAFLSKQMNSSYLPLIKSTVTLLKNLHDAYEFTHNDINEGNLCIRGKSINLESYDLVLLDFSTSSFRMNDIFCIGQVALNRTKEQLIETGDNEDPQLDEVIERRRNIDMCKLCSYIIAMEGPLRKLLQRSLLLKDEKLLSIADMINESCPVDDAGHVLPSAKTDDELGLKYNYLIKILGQQCRRETTFPLVIQRRSSEGQKGGVPRIFSPFLRDMDSLIKHFPVQDILHPITKYAIETTPVYRDADGVVYKLYTAQDYDTFYCRIQRISDTESISDADLYDVKQVDGKKYVTIHKSSLLEAMVMDILSDNNIISPILHFGFVIEDGKVYSETVYKKDSFHQKTMNDLDFTSDETKCSISGVIYDLDALRKSHGFIHNRLWAENIFTDGMSYYITDFRDSVFTVSDMTFMSDATFARAPKSPFMIQSHDVCQISRTLFTPTDIMRTRLPMWDSVEMDVLRDYLRDQNIADEKRPVLSRLIERQPPMTRTLFRGQKHWDLLPSDFYSTSSDIQVALDFAQYPQGTLFIIHCVGVPVLDVNDIFKKANQENDRIFKDRKREHEFLVLGGGKFFTSWRLETEGVTKLVPFAPVKYEELSENEKLAANIRFGTDSGIAEMIYAGDFKGKLLLETWYAFPKRNKAEVERIKAIEAPNPGTIDYQSLMFDALKSGIALVEVQGEIPLNKDGKLMF